MNHSDRAPFCISWSKAERSTSSTRIDSSTWASEMHNSTRSKCNLACCFCLCFCSMCPHTNRRRQHTEGPRSRSGRARQRSTPSQRKKARERQQEKKKKKWKPRRSLKRERGDSAYTAGQPAQHHESPTSKRAKAKTASHNSEAWKCIGLSWGGWAHEPRYLSITEISA